MHQPLSEESKKSLYNIENSCSIPHGIYLRFSDEFWMFPKRRAVVICYGVLSKLV